MDLPQRIHPAITPSERRLVPASDGGVGASRGEVDAGVLNTLVLAVEEVRKVEYTSVGMHWSGRVPTIIVTFLCCSDAALPWGTLFRVLTPYNIFFE